MLAFMSIKNSDHRPVFLDYGRYHGSDSICIVESFLQLLHSSIFDLIMLFDNIVYIYWSSKITSFVKLVIVILHFSLQMEHLIFESGCNLIAEADTSFLHNIMKIILLSMKSLSHTAFTVIYRMLFLPFCSDYMIKKQIIKHQRSVECQFSV